MKSPGDPYDEIKNRLARIESRLCTVMRALGLDPHKDDSQLNKEPPHRTEGNRHEKNSF